MRAYTHLHIYAHTCAYALIHKSIYTHGYTQIKACIHSLFLIHLPVSNIRRRVQMETAGASGDWMLNTQPCLCDPQQWVCNSGECRHAAPVAGVTCAEFTLSCARENKTLSDLSDLNILLYWLLQRRGVSLIKSWPPVSPWVSFKMV